MKPKGVVNVVHEEGKEAFVQQGEVGLLEFLEDIIGSNKFMLEIDG